MRLWRALWLIPLLAGAPVGASALADQAAPAAAIRFAPEKDYGPFVFEDEQGRIRGLSVDMLDAVAARAGLQVATLPARNLSAILEAAQRGEVDLITSLRPTPERARFLAFTRPYVTVPAVLVRRTDNTAGLQLADLAGRPVAVGKGYAVEAFVRKTFPAVAWVAEPDDVASLRDLAAGKVAAVVVDLASVGFIARRYHLEHLQVVGPVGFDYPLSFAFAKSRPDIGVALEAGLRALRPHDRDAIGRHWLRSDVLSYRDPRTDPVLTLAGVLGAIAAAVLGLALWQGVRRRAQPS